MLAVVKQTGETPFALLHKPELLPWLSWYWEAFWLLSPARAIHQGSIGNIPLSEMRAYMEIFQLKDNEAKWLFIRMMYALDSFYVKRVNAEIKRKTDVERANRER